MPRHARSTSAPKLTLPHVHYRRGCLRPHERATVETAGCLHCFHGRTGYGWHDYGHMVGTCAHVDRGGRILWLQGTVLARAAELPGE
jgi:hypothetical protein